MKTSNASKINMVVDPTGGTGKTTLARFCVHNGVCKVLRAMESIRSVMDASTIRGKMHGAYMFDVPRGLADRGMSSFFAFVEALKDGYLNDNRYENRCIWFDAPQVWVFSSQEPQLKYLRSNRWKFWKIENRTLVDYYSGNDAIKTCCSKLVAYFSAPDPSKEDYLSKLVTYFLANETVAGTSSKNKTVWFMYHT